MLCIVCKSACDFCLPVCLSLCAFVSVCMLCVCVCVLQCAGTRELAAMGPANIVFSFSQYVFQALQVAAIRWVGLDCDLGSSVVGTQQHKTEMGECDEQQWGLAQQPEYSSPRHDQGYKNPRSSSPTWVNMLKHLLIGMRSGLVYSSLAFIRTPSVKPSQELSQFAVTSGDITGCDCELVEFLSRFVLTAGLQAIGAPQFRFCLRPVWCIHLMKQGRWCRVDYIRNQFLPPPPPRPPIFLGLIDQVGHEQQGT